MPHVEITDDTFLSGKPAWIGEVYEMDEATAKLTVECKRGKIVAAPPDHVIEPPRSKVKRVEK